MSKFTINKGQIDRHGLVEGEIFEFAITENINGDLFAPPTKGEEQFNNSHVGKEVGVLIPYFIVETPFRARIVSLNTKPKYENKDDFYYYIVLDRNINKISSHEDHGSNYRNAYEEAYGSIPEGWHIHHKIAKFRGGW